VGGCGGWRERRRAGRKVAEFEANCILAEQEFTRLDQTRQYRNKVEPILYWIYLILGILCIVISAIIVVHMFVYLIIKPNGQPLKPFLNAMLEDIETSNASFFATVIFALIGYYIFACAFIGHVKIGM